MEKTPHCPECGAPLGEAQTCEALFHAALAMEWEDPPRSAAAHHLLVATYMVQHPSQFTEEGRLAFAAMVITAVDEGLSAPELRERQRGRFEQQQRDWNFKAKNPAPPQLREWSMTIADALDGPAQTLPERVWRWARCVRAELRD